MAHLVLVRNRAMVCDNYQFRTWFAPKLRFAAEDAF